MFGLFCLETGTLTISKLKKDAMWDPQIMSSVHIQLQYIMILDAELVILLLQLPECWEVSSTKLGSMLS